MLYADLVEWVCEPQKRGARGANQAVLDLCHLDLKEAVSSAQYFSQNIESVNLTGCTKLREIPTLGAALSPVT